MWGSVRLSSWPEPFVSNLLGSRRAAESKLSEEERNVEIVQESGDMELDVAAFVASAVPCIGCPVSNVLGGMSTDRKFKRVDEVLRGFAEDLRNFRSDVSEP